jgi:hypothetical protein
VTGADHGARPDFFEPVLGWRIWWRRDEQLFEVSRARPRSTSAPDAIEPVAGWRIWRVVERSGRFLLASLYVNVAWPSRAPLEAKCHQFLFHGPHRAPFAECTCGIYSTPLSGVPVSPLGRRFFPTVIGTLALWGDVVECERGWRAQLGYPQRLFVPRIGKRPNDRDDRVVAGLAHYGIPVEILHVPRREDVVPRLAELTGGVERLLAA